MHMQTYGCDTTQCNTPATYQGCHTARIFRGRPLMLFLYLFTFEILPNFNLVREFWKKTARVPPVITTFPKFTLRFLWYLHHYNQIQRELGGSSESYTRSWGLSLYKQLFTNDLHRFCTTRATTCPVHALLKQDIIAGSHITSCHRYILQEQLVVLEETQILSLIHHLGEKGKGNGVSDHMLSECSSTP